MEATELRIGNIIDQGTILELRRTVVRLSYYDDINQHRTSLVRYEDLQPLPLTDTILEKLPQFKKVPYLGEEGHYYEFDLDCGLGLLSGDNNDVLVCDLDNVRFEYLHQLQNFVDSLGIELIVNI